MTAPERFADRQIPLAPRAPSIHGAHRLGVVGEGRHLSRACACGGGVRDSRWEDEVAYVRSRTAGVMTTLMRNGRDRRSENPSGPTRYLSACNWPGPISG